MKKIGFFVLALLLAAFWARAQQRQYGVYAVGFYNLENLFDTLHDAGKNDYDFLPDGSYRWNKLRYEHKLANMSRVLLDMGTDKLPGIGASIIGVSEVENSRALDDLVAQPAMKERGFKYIHIEGPDKRGVDCALIYNPRFFKPEKYFLGSDLYDAVKHIKENPMQPTLPDDIEFGELGKEGVRWRSNQEDQYLNYRAKIRK